MATIKRVKRLANPFRKRKARNARRKARRRNPRRLTAKQIKYFGTKRQRAALKRRRNGTRARRRKSTRNPALVVTLGTVNPQRKRNTMATRRRRKASRNPRRRRRSTILALPRRRNSFRRRRYARRNPANIFTGSNLKLVTGGLIGVTATKVLSSMMPAGIRSMMGSFGGVGSAAIAAFLASWAGEKVLPGEMGKGVTFGALMIVGSAVINMVAPGFRIGDQPIALAGLGDLVPGSFVVPQNPLRALPPPPPTAQNRTNMNGLSRAFGTAF